MTESQQENYNSDNTPGFLSTLREKTGGRNGVKFLACIVGLQSMALLLYYVWETLTSPLLGKLGIDHYLPLMAIVASIVFLAVLMYFGYRIGWILLAPILVLLMTALVTVFVSDLPDLVSQREIFLVPLLVILNLILIVLQAFRPSVLAALRIRPVVAEILFILPCVAGITFALVSLLLNSK